MAPSPLFLLLVVALAACASAQTIPSAAECQGRVARLGGADSLLARLSACQSGASSGCCSAANGLLGQGGDLGLCLCTQAGLQATLDQVASNALARAVGVTAASVQQTLSACKVPNAALPGSCPSGGAAAAPTAAATPAAPAATTTAAPAATTTAAPVAATTSTQPTATTTTTAVGKGGLLRLGGKSLGLGVGHPLLAGKGVGAGIGKNPLLLGKGASGGGLLLGSGSAATTTATTTTTTLGFGQKHPLLAAAIGGRRRLADASDAAKAYKSNPVPANWFTWVDPAAALSAKP